MHIQILAWNSHTLCGGVKPVNERSTLPSLLYLDVNVQTKNTESSIQKSSNPKTTTRPGRNARKEYKDRKTGQTHHQDETTRKTTTNARQTRHRKIKLEQHETRHKHKNLGDTRWSGSVSMSCLTCGTSHVSSIGGLLDSHFRRWCQEMTSYP